MSENSFQVRLKNDLESLSKKGKDIIFAAHNSHKAGQDVNVNQKYQDWYTLACRVVKLCALDRLGEFKLIYEGKLNRKYISVDTFGIRDFLGGIRKFGSLTELQVFNYFFMLLQNQFMIFESVRNGISEKLFQIESEIRHEVWQDDLQQAEALQQKGHPRAAGALAGVVLEGHLKAVARARNLLTSKKSATISECNEALKAGDVYDIPMWRLVQRLGDIRNLCVHKKERDPTADGIADLLSGTRKIIAEVS